MRVLQINSVYGAGSTGKITQAIHEGIAKDGIESAVVFGRGPSSDDARVIRVCGDLYGKANNLLAQVSGLRYGGCWLSTKKIEKIIGLFRPDVVHLQCVNGHFVNIYHLIEWLKRSGLPVVLTLHADFMFTANCSSAFECDEWKTGCNKCPRLKDSTKSWFFNRSHESFERMRSAFDGFGSQMSVVSVSPWLMSRAQESLILGSFSHRTIMNGLDTKTFCPQDPGDLIKRHNIDGRRIVFHATAMFRDVPGDPKGGWYVLRLAKRMESLPVLFVVAGKNDIKGSIPENVILLGEVRDQKLLARWYSLADVSLVVSEQETFSLPCAESLCCGTPVVGFLSGGPGSIAIPQYSAFVPYGDVGALEKALARWLDKDVPKEEIAIAAAERYSKERMVEQYEQEYRRVACLPAV